MAVFRFMQQSSDPGAFPSRRQLLQAGRSDLVHAILQAGGWLAIGWETDEEEAARGVAPTSAAARLPSGVANSLAERDDSAAPSQPPDAEVDLGTASAAQNPRAAAVATAELDEMRQSCGSPSTADDVVKAGNATAKPTGSRRLKKQRGYWGCNKNVSRELRAFAKEAGHPSTAPTQEEVYAAHRMDLYHALKRRGGWGVVPQLFGLHQDTTLVPGETGVKIAGPHRQQGTVARAPYLRPATSPMTDQRQATVRREQGLPHQSQRPLLRTVEAAVPTLEIDRTVTEALDRPLKRIRPRRRRGPRPVEQDNEEAAGASEPATETWSDMVHAHDGSLATASHVTTSATDPVQSDADSMADPSSYEALPLAHSDPPAVVQRINSMEERIQQLELTLAAARAALQSSRAALLQSEQDFLEVQAQTVSDLVGVSESLEVREGIIQRTRSELRSTRAQVSALEGALAVEDWSTSSNSEAGDKLLEIDGHGSMHVIRVVWPDPASTVFLTGSYDNWSTQTQLEKSNAGVFVATLQLYPGRYQIKFIVDGVWRVDPRREIVYSDGHENNQLTIL
eukprot:SM000053S17489  [mRNA]  locus=s53:750374:754015:- [translate_table: standard]